MIISRRLFLTGASASAIAAPAIVRAASLMPVRALAFDPMFDPFAGWVLSEDEFLEGVLLRTHLPPLTWRKLAGEAWRNFNDGDLFDD